VDERRRVKKLHHGRHPHGVGERSIAAHSVGRKQRQRGSHALAARSTQVVADVGDDLNVRARLFLELGLDEFEFRRDETEDASGRELGFFDERGVPGCLHSLE
jgi:hypothetical protein